MSAKPNTNPATLRNLVREVLAMAPGYGWTDAMLTRSVAELLPGQELDATELLAAAEWNLARDFVSALTNEDSDEREWRITRHGIAKQTL